MATNIIVNPTELETISGQIESKNNTLKEKLDEFAKKFDEISQTWDSSASRRTFDAINSLNDERMKDAIKMYFIYEKSQGEIASKYNFSRQFVSHLIK